MNSRKKTKLVLSGLLALSMLFVLLVSSAFAEHNGGRVLHADLSSANEVPPSGTGATGAAQFTLNQGQNRVCWSVNLDGLAGDVVAMHIHVGEAGVNGGVAVGLVVDEDLSGCTTADKDVIKAIRQNPSGYYLNVHTTAVPSGEVRGQLSK